VNTPANLFALWSDLVAVLEHYIVTVSRLPKMNHRAMTYPDVPTQVRVRRRGRIEGLVCTAIVLTKRLDNGKVLLLAMAPAAVDIGEPGWSVMQYEWCILSEHVQGYLRPCLGCSKWRRNSPIHMSAE
jgi:hypothetical protein